MSNVPSRIGRHAFLTVVPSFLGIVTGILLDAIIMGLFGMGWQSDAYFIAITIPLFVITVITLQATRVIQPLFISKQQNEGENEAWRFLSLMITNGTVLIGILSVIAGLTSPLLIRLQAIGAESSMITLSTRLSILLFFLIVPLYSAIAIMRAALNSLDIFSLPAAMKLIENAFKIVFLLFLGSRLGVMSLVLGMFCGAVVQVVLFYLALKGKGYKFRPVFGLRHPDLARASRLMVFPLAGQGLGAAVELVNNALGSKLGAGNVTALRLATRIIESIGGLLGGSVVLAAIPAISSRLSARNVEAATRDFRHTLYLLLLVTLPVSTWLALTNRALIGLIYQRMSFSEADTVLVANLLLAMIPFVFLGRLMGLAEIPFFATYDTRTPLLAVIIHTAIYIVVSLSMVSLLGIFAVPLGRFLSYLTASLFLLHMLRGRIGNLGFASLRDRVAKIMWATVIMGLFITIGASLSRLMPSAGAFTSKAIALGLPSFAGGIALLFALIFARLIDPAMVKSTLYSLRGEFKS
jgi:putative peptidoglycan lipid II flippase